MIDNIDYNPSSTTAAPNYVLHGTSISKLNHYTYHQDNAPVQPVPVQPVQIGNKCTI